MWPNSIRSVGVSTPAVGGAASVLTGVPWWIEFPAVMPDHAASTEHNVAVYWQHTLSDVISAIAGAGLRLQFLHEHEFTLFEHFDGAEPGRRLERFDTWCRVGFPVAGRATASAADVFAAGGETLTDRAHGRPAGRHRTRGDPARFAATADYIADRFSTKCATSPMSPGDRACWQGCCVSGTGSTAR